MHDKIKILKDILGQHRVSNQEYLFLCPYCGHHKKKFSVNVDKNVYKCWICDTRGLDLYRVVRRFGTFKQAQDWRILAGQMDLDGFEDIFAQPKAAEEEKISLPEEFVSLANRGLPFTAKNALRYLKKRGVTREDILRWKIGYCPDGDYGSRIIIPSFGMSGYSNFFEARTYRGDWMKYKKPKASKDIIFNELYVDWTKDLILVEGVFDAIRAYSIGTPIPILGSTVRVDSRLFQKIVRYHPRTYVALDSDAKDKAFVIADNLMNYDIEVYSLDTSGYEDIADMPKDVLLERKRIAVRMNSNNFLLGRIRSL